MKYIKKKARLTKRQVQHEKDKTAAIAANRYVEGCITRPGSFNK